MSFLAGRAGARFASSQAGKVAGEAATMFGDVMTAKDSQSAAKDIGNGSFSPMGFLGGAAQGAALEHMFGRYGAVVGAAGNAAYGANQNKQ